MKQFFIISALLLWGNFLFSQVSVEISYISQPQCFGQYGYAQASAINGSGNYSFYWSSGETNYWASMLAGGPNYVVVTDNTNSTTDTAYLTINTFTEITGSTVLTAPTCFNLSDGSINLTVSGGVPPYTYTWDNGSTNQDLYNIGSGTYYTSVTDANYCNFYTSVTLSAPASIMAYPFITASTCGGSNGSVSTNAYGGTQPYYYQWDDPGHSTASGITNVSAGTYHYTITDNNGCVFFDFVNVSDSNGAEIFGTQTNITCFGADNGSVSVTTQGGTLPLAYDWSNGDTLPALTGLVPGFYKLTVTDYNGCKSLSNFFISEPQQLIASVNKNGGLCFNTTSSGDMWVTTSGGTPGYTYLWNTGDTTDYIYNYSAGIYTVTVTDINNCMVVQADTIEPATEIIFSHITQDALCNGYNGNIDITVSGGSPPYAYTWYDQYYYWVSNTEDLFNLGQGIFHLNVTDASGCSVSFSDTIQNTLNSLTVDAVVTDVVCYGDTTGAVDITLSGGNPPYTFAWSVYMAKNSVQSGKAGAIGSLFPPTEDLVNVPSGYYQVDIMDSSGCTFVNNFYVNGPLMFEVYTNPVNPGCGSSNGSISTNVINGVPPYAYYWSDSSVNDSITGIGAGNYFLTVTDSSGCLAFAQQVLSDSTGPIVSFESMNVTCYGLSDGSAIVYASGGTAAITRLWSTGDTSQAVNNLSAGIYYVTVSNGACSSIGTIEIFQPEEIIIDLFADPVACHGDSNGYISSTVTGAFQALYNWSDSTSGTYAFGLHPGMYYLTVTDMGTSCTAVDSAYVAEPPAININNISFTDVTCKGNNDGTITIDADAGGYGLIYSLIAEGYVPDSIFTDLSASDYNVYIKFDTLFNCTFVSPVISIIEPPFVSGSYSIQNISCYGAGDAVITISPAGGTAPYTFSIDNGATFVADSVFTGLGSGNYTIKISDANSCSMKIGEPYLSEPADVMINLGGSSLNCSGDQDGYVNMAVYGGFPPYSFLWSNNDTLQNISNLPGGTYTVTVSDNHNCQYIGSAVVFEPAQLILNTVATNVTCQGLADGMIDLTATGGTIPYTYNISGLQSQSGAGTVSFGPVAPGTYSITVYDANVCMVYDGVSITEPTAPLSLAVTSTDITCYAINNGKGFASANGGTVPYTFYWSNAVTGDSITGLAPGAYQITVNDANGCTLSDSIIVNEPAALVLDSLITSNPSCYGASDGYIIAYSSGGTGPHVFTIDNINFQVTGLFDTLADGAYFISVVDANNCTLNIPETTLMQPAELFTALSVTNPACYGEATGSITANVTGGTAPYTYQWGANAGNATTQNVSGLPAGVYHVTVTDFNNCTKTDSAVLTQPSAPLVSSSYGVDLTCNQYQNGKVFGLASGGTAPYSFYWSTDVNADSLVNQPAGVYYLTVTDYNGCTTGDTVSITEPAALVIDTFMVTNPSCFGSSDGSIEVFASGGTGTLQYTSDSISFYPTGLFNGLSAGVYSIEVIDQNNCYINIPVQTLSQPALLTTMITVVDPGCSGEATGSATVSAGGGSPSYTYLWDSGTGYQTTSLADNLPAGIFFVTVSDSHNCTKVDSAVLSEPALLTASVTKADVSCFGACNGTVTITAGGGTMPYNYNISGGQYASLCAGVYNYTVTDANACMFTGIINISEPEIISLSASSTVSSCNVCSGTINITAGGGTTPYLFAYPGVSQPTGYFENLCTGTYSITVTDVNGCAADTLVFVDQMALSVITGEAHWTGGNLPDNSATVELYRIVDITQAELAYSTPLLSSQFTFNDVAYGEYFVKVDITDGTALPNVLSSYLDSTTLWTMADTIPVTCQNSFNLHIPMYEVTPPVGQPLGTISGYITYSDFTGGKGVTSYEGPKLSGEPVPGAEIFIELEPDDQPITNTTTNDTGFYIVPGLAGGNSYSMTVDIPGLPMISTYTNIGINPDSNTYTQMNFYVDTSSNGGGIFVDTTATKIIRHENEKFSLEIYPNPFSESLGIHYDLVKEGNVTLEIYDINGKVVASFVREKQQAGDYTYLFNAAVSGIRQGNYIVKLQVDNAVFLKKVVQIK